MRHCMHLPVFRRRKQQQEAEAERLRKEKADKEAADKAAAGQCVTPAFVHNDVLLKAQTAAWQLWRLAQLCVHLTSRHADAHTDRR